MLNSRLLLWKSRRIPVLTVRPLAMPSFGAGRRIFFLRSASIGEVELWSVSWPPTKAALLRRKLMWLAPFQSRWSHGLDPV